MSSPATSPPSPGTSAASDKYVLFQTIISATQSRKKQQTELVSQDCRLHWTPLQTCTGSQRAVRREGQEEEGEGVAAHHLPPGGDAGGPGAQSLQRRGPGPGNAHFLLLFHKQVSTAVVNYQSKHHSQLGLRLSFYLFSYLVNALDIGFAGAGLGLQ